MKPIAILGAGPAGLMAAHAAALRGKPIAIITKGDHSGSPVKSRLGGAQFLHAPLPYVNNEEEPDGMLRYMGRGDTKGYRKKVYGDNPNVPFVSMEGFSVGSEHPAWSLIETYERLWELMSGDKANVEDITPAWLADAIDKQWFDAIVSTIPLTQLCLSHQGMLTNGAPHQFTDQKILIHNECVLEDLPDNSIYYNGDLSQSWYRCSKIFGVGSTEWSTLGQTPPYPGLVSARKPIKTNCDCFPEVFRAGRHGAWTKGVLTHHAFEAVLEFLA